MERTTENRNEWSEALEREREKERFLIKYSTTYAISLSLSLSPQRRDERWKIVSHATFRGNIYDVIGSASDAGCRSLRLRAYLRPSSSSRSEILFFVKRLIFLFTFDTKKYKFLE